MMSRSWVGVQVLLLLLSLLADGRGQDYPHYNFDDLPDLSLPKDLEGLEGFADVGGGPRGEGGDEFRPDGVVQGLMMGDVIRRIENLEILCQDHVSPGTPRATSPTLEADEEGGLKLNALPNDMTLTSSNHYVVPGPEMGADFTGQFSPTPQQLQKTMTMIQDSVLVIASEQDKLREEFQQVLLDLQAVRQEMSDVKAGLSQSRTELLTAVRRADTEIKGQDSRLQKLAQNVSSIDNSLGGFHRSFYELSSLNRSVLVAMKVQKQTRQKLTGLTGDVKTLRNNVGDLQENWNKTMKETSRRLQRSYTVGKDVNKLQKQFHSMKTRFTRLHGKKCESGRWMFMNYPFSYGKWPQSHPVKFAQPFSRRPELTHGMTQLDVNYRYNTRARVRVVGLDTKGFSLVCDGWYNTRLYRVEVSWMACVV
ncbi:uncharacterized protein LOC124125475 [Haliotis rufescens]|uniref:uncharacterized protein LOC124125475 n=1 Tax=Haliotis rufescens TaxID=6454 RepID=UPI00201F0E7C|nr:uncharacterized protein LOC124125475 [Haliotis rufescens]